MNTNTSPPRQSPTEGDRSTAPESNTDPAPEQSTADALRDAGKRLVEIGEYASYLASTKIDRAKLQLHGAMFTAFATFVGLMAVGAVVVVAVVLLLVGAANGLGAAMGRLWLGQLIVAVGALLVVFLSARLIVSVIYGMSRKKTVEKYESRKQEQRTRFGHDVTQRAEERRQ